MKTKGVGCLLLLIGVPLILATLVFAFSEFQLRRVYAIPLTELSIPADELSLARGKFLVEAIGACGECHGGYLLNGNRNFLHEPLIGVVPAANLTAGKGGIGTIYTAADWERAIRHGVGRDGRALMGVSSGALQHLSDADVGAMVAYLQTIAPFDNELPPRQIGPLARPFLFFAFILPEEENDIMPAVKINHAAPHLADVEPGVTVEYGRYLVNLTCVECHKVDLGGGANPGEGMNITTGGNLGGWTEAEFIHALKSGITPEGNSLNDSEMPQARLRHLSEDELKAIWLYVQSVPPVTMEK
ncbi:MAG: c-type cytochrome [Anaerolineales bacterium]|nr:c-type cytochrome [Anaerolineales bacterium]